ncbi:anti-phage ZorAB system protein ZorA [Comamonas testosteroni]|uniref:anti-phage ZorAB system protein ZorA n=1 Tax=Comamonas testosteroni TaxID=285 RepID=UPI000556C40E|nr:anti-phage ZorAB system protein ZorA [Comamonas testosteroni]
MVGLIQNPQIWAPVVVVSLVLAFSVWFAISYWWPAGKLVKALKHINRQLAKVRQMDRSQRKKQAGKVFESSPLKQLWAEYEDTLHDQYKLVDGERQLTKSRATAGAESFFTSHAVVDARIGTEFFKHLPGILTGIGIIGTFFGLILGLQGFDLSALEKVGGDVADASAQAAQQITESVGKLLTDVKYAFYGSIVSIIASIVVTALEKQRLNACYQQLGELVENIDGLFDSGVTEEYLAELVQAGVESATQTRQLKDSLVTDLREMLQNLVDTQVRESLKLADTLSVAYRDSGQQLAEQVSGAIVGSLAEPLKSIAGAVQQASGDQSSQVQGLLQEVLMAFMSKLENTFGQQFSGLSQMMGQSVGAMQSMQQGFNELLMKLESAGQASTDHNAKATAQMLSDMQAGQNAMQASMNEMLGSLQQAVVEIGNAGQGGAERMAKQLEALFAQSEQRQQVMAESLQAFVASVQSSVGQGQQEILDRLGSAVDRLSEQLESMFAQTGALQKQAQEDSKQSTRAVHASTQAAMAGISEQLQQIFLQSGTLQKQAHADAEQSAQAVQASAQAAIGGLSSQLQGVFEQTEALRKQAQTDARETALAMQSSSQQAVAGLELQVQTLLKAVATQHDAVHERAVQLSTQTAQNIQQMQQGADKMRLAAERFDTAGEGVTKAGQATVSAMGAFQGTSNALVTAGQELSSVVSDYRNHRDAVGKTLAVLQTVMASTEGESAGRQQYLRDLQTHAERLQVINRDASNYLDQVNEVLGRGFGEFSDNMNRTLTKTMGSLDAELGKAITQLGGGVEVVRDSLEQLSEALDTVRRGG